MTVLGIDPGFDRCGWAVVTGSGSTPQALAFDCIQTAKRDGKFARLDQIRRTLIEILTENPVDALAMETLFFSRNVSTALPVSEVRGLIIGLALERGLPVAEYPPATVKLAVAGYGRAEKSQVTKMAARLLRLEKIPKIDDTGDALAVGLTHWLQAPRRQETL
jgi:crossover junction endodeoxyribonuclease RuvC